MIEFSNNIQRAKQAIERYEQCCIGLGLEMPDRTSLLMDLTASDGKNGNPSIDWFKLLASPRSDFVHDVSGIQGHIDRTTGQLTGRFLPRCAADSDDEPEPNGFDFTDSRVAQAMGEQIGPDNEPS